MAIAPPPLNRIIAKCLAKDPDARWQSAHDLADELRWISSGAASHADVAAIAGARVAMPTWPRRREWLAWTLFAIALLASVALAVPYFRPAPPPSAVRFTLAPPDGVDFGPAGAPIAPFPAVSPDGKRFVFLAGRPGEQTTLWVRALDLLEARPLSGNILPGVGPAASTLPFWSPDSRSIGFFADGKLKRVGLDGGAPQTICDAPQSFGAAWGGDGTIVFSRKETEGLFKVQAAGGSPVQVTKVDAERGELGHANPAFLADGRHFLYWVRSKGGSAIWVGSIDAAFAPKQLVSSDSRAEFAPPGHVLFVREGTLFAQGFDPTRLETTGDPIALAEDVRTNIPNGRSAFTASSNAVIYRTGEATAGLPLAWFDRSGRQVAMVPESKARTTSMSLAPDARRVMAQINDDRGGSDLWMIDLDNGTRSRVTFDPQGDFTPVLSPDGTEVVFSSSRAGLGNLHRKRADGVGDDRVLVKSDALKLPSDWTRHWIVFSSLDIKNKEDLWVMPVDGEPKPYLQTEFRERLGRLSPDERWMAYTSDETGQDAIYLRPFPDASGGKWRVSGIGGGSIPTWRADGKELFFSSSNGEMMAVLVRPGQQAPELGVPQALFQRVGGAGTWYAVTRDGSRFLMPFRSDVETPLNVILNWPALLERK